MIAILQRVKDCHVSIENQIYNAIGEGLLVLLGVEQTDGQREIEWLTQKIAQMRIFPDAEGKMNKSICDSEGDVLVISQFTLCANILKGNRPSFISAAAPEKAIPLYEDVVKHLQGKVKGKVKTGKFGADMDVQLTNWGPVTIVIRSSDKFDK